MIDDLVSEWQEQWLAILRNQIHTLHHRRQIHDEFLALLDAQDHRDTWVFREAFHGMYVESQVLAIRRQADDDSRTVSLRRLIGQLEQHRREFTRSSYVARWMKGKDPTSTDDRERRMAEFHLRNANDAFDKFTDKSGDEHLGGGRLQEDRDELLAMTDSVVRYANASIAHTERRPETTAVTYAEFEAAIDHLGEMLKRYVLLLDQGGLMTATPAIQADWRGPFRRPLAARG